MIRKTIKQMLTAQVLSALTVSLCLLIDNIMIGNFIGVRGLTAYGLANPLLLFVGAIGSMLSAGVQVVCSRSLGKGQKDETDKGYSSAIAIVLFVSLFVVLAVVLFRTPLARLLGAGGNKELLKDTGDYLVGFVVGALGSMGALILVPFLQMAGKSNLLIFSVLGMTIADIALDYLLAVVLPLRMLGMGLASSASYYIALLIGGRYFLKKDCVFHFKFAYVKVKKMLELLKAGIPTVVNMATSVGLIFIMNRLLLKSGGSMAVAAYSVICTVGNAANCISTGSGGVALTLSSMFYHEEDRTGLREMLSSLKKYSLLMGLVMTGAIMAAAPLIISLFVPEAGASQDMAVSGARWYACGLTFCCINNAIRSTWQGCERVTLTELTSILEGFVLPVLAALLLRAATGVDAIWAFYFAGEAITLLGIYLYTSVKKHNWLPVTANQLLLPEGFGVAEGDLIEANITSTEDVLSAARAASDFCLAHGQTSLIANRIALCIEEMGTNTVKYGFTDGRPHQLNVRVQHKGERWILRFRDDCHAFDPVSHIPSGDAQDSLGIRVLLGMSREIRYTYSMNLNNLTIVVK